MIITKDTIFLLIVSLFKIHMQDAITRKNELRMGMPCKMKQQFSLQRCLLYPADISLETFTVTLLNVSTIPRLAVFVSLKVATSDDLLLNAIPHTSCSLQYSPRDDVVVNSAFATRHIAVYTNTHTVVYSCVLPTL